MLRDDQFLNDLPDNLKPDFTDITSDSENSYKLQILKNKIKKKFVRSNHSLYLVFLFLIKELLTIHLYAQSTSFMITYSFQPDRTTKYAIRYDGYDQQNKLVKFSGLEDFSSKVFTFFKRRIESQYPIEKRKSVDIFTKRKEQHEAFMQSRSEDVLGRDDVLKQVESYLYDSSIDTPFLILGNAGSGKSSILAKIASNAREKVLRRSVKPYRNREWRLFCHFVGAVPESTAIDSQ